MARILDPWARTRWALWHGAVVTVMSLMAAVVTDNPNWYWNIPLGMALGSAWGLVTWPVYMRMGGRR